jgi:hypothetical protein
MASGRPIDLMKSVVNPRKPFITKPAMMHFISEIPDPAAYGAKLFTSLAAVNENKAAKRM